MPLHSVMMHIIVNVNIWGCMCSTGPFQFRWLKGYIYSSSYYDHQIRSVNLTHCCHTFPLVVCLRCLLYHILSIIAHTFLVKWDFVFIIIVQFMMSANSRIHYGLQIVFVFCILYHLIIIIVQTYLNTLNLLNTCQISFVECVWVW